MISQVLYFVNLTEYVMIDFEIEFDLVAFLLITNYIML